MVLQGNQQAGGGNKDVLNACFANNYKTVSAKEAKSTVASWDGVGDSISSSRHHIAIGKQISDVT